MNGICFCTETPMEYDDEECPNFILVRTGGWEFVFAADANPTNCCCMQSSAAQRCNEIPALANASSRAAWTDLGPCPRSEDLGRVVGERLLATSWGQRHFHFDLDEVDEDFEGRCLRLKEQLDP